MRSLPNISFRTLLVFALVASFSLRTFALPNLYVNAQRVSALYNQPLPTFPYVLSGFINGETQATACTGAPVLTTPAVQGSPIGAYTINVYPNPSTNWGNTNPTKVGNLSCPQYNILTNTSVLYIKSNVLTVTANPTTISYGSPKPAFPYTITGFLNGDPATVVRGVPTVNSSAKIWASHSGQTLITSPVGTYQISPTWGSLSAAHYTFTFVKGTLTITPATTPLTITAKNLTIANASLIPSLFAYTVSGLLSTDSATTAGTGTLHLATTATPGSPAGNYPITVNAGSFLAPNYSGVIYVNGTLTIKAASTAINGSCGSSNGATLSSAPTTGLCASGSNSAVSGTGPWDWSCNGSNGGSTASCSASKQLTAVNGVCGAANGVGVFNPPIANLCSTGTSTAVSGSSPFTWSCGGSNGGSTASCSAPLEVNGVCGSSNGATLSSSPITGLCSSGSNSAVSGTGPWDWSCNGSNGGGNASCSASITQSQGVNCPSQNVFWASSNAICYGAASATNTGSSITVTAGGSSTGNATFTCANGNFSLPNTTNCVAGAAFYISPNGNDSNNGRSSSSPFLTLEQAQTAMENSSSIKTAYLMGGTYNRTKVLSLTNWNDGGQAWLAYPGQTPILDGAGSVTEAIYSTANNMVVHGLTIQNYAQTGIDMTNTSNTTIDGNTILHLQSTWTGEAFIFTHWKFYNSQITHNYGNHNTGPGIVLVSGSASEDISNVLIDSNKVLNTNTSLSDTGGIYILDRGHLNTGIVISHNIIGDFGPTNTKAIYLDDESSWVSVINNIVYGPGEYGVQYHGSNNDVLTNNIFDVSSIQKIGLYQDDVSSGFLNYGMAGNGFTHNLVYSSGAIPGWDYLDSTNGGIAMLGDTDNLYYSGSGTYNSTVGQIIDSNPDFINPLFVNPAANNYTLQRASPASQVGFVGIDASTIGPITP